MIENLVVGAGVAGCVIANRLAQKNKQVLIVEKRNKIGGQAHDSYNKKNVLVHDYGPHIFHTDSEEVFKLLSEYTDWILYNHEVLGFIDNNFVPIPFNINSIAKLFPSEKGNKYIKNLISYFNYGEKITIWDLKNSSNEILKELAEYIYNKVFYNYTLKQWDCSPEQLDREVTSKVPVNISKDNRYFFDKYQMIPAEGYTTMFRKMIEMDNISLLLNTDFKDILSIKNGDFKLYETIRVKNIFYTAPIDYFFDFEFGKLPYRSLKFKHETYSRKYYQQNAVINYPNNYDFTRVTEFKHITKQKTPFTTIAKEYPQKCNLEDGDIPYYPIPKRDNREIYYKYSAKVKRMKNFYPVGRLAQYEYLNMTQAIENALKTVAKL
ncbi:MAG: UDP-galactopyranose mutase [Candidatus Mcinerneyibacterium aminivorans]|uniref:UDP-galactopyranose mutase n=1 Tax=Candidatus Mcinerneyibacterium aminivorans TaxID=2703815 RepID=A0A5D0MJQ5_9BACT|nr:MAG: UDP-galactopyranose mutase [Candidatus Mcinerneyibacterium aminivorans]